MKAVKFVLGVLAAAWTIGVFVGFAPRLFSMDFSPQGISELGGGLAAMLICGLITFWLFQSALKNNVPPPAGRDDDETS
jgi:hypothetical protein